MAEEKRNVNVRVIKATQEIQKGDAYQSMDSEQSTFLREKGLLEHPYDQNELFKLTEYSTILQQCVEAYRRNITGFGTEVIYKEDMANTKENPEMTKEKDTVHGFTRHFNFDTSFEELFGDVIEDREKTGNGYLELIRDGKNAVAGGERLDPRYMYLTKLGKRIKVEHVMDGEKFTRYRRFRRFAQQLNDGEIVWFKELGDPRFMNSTTGDYTDFDNGADEATEILHLKIGQEAYGRPRYIGQLIHMYGARKAEELNYNYFYQGRHTPAAVVVSNGMLTEESIGKLEDYAKSVQGTENAHKFLLIEAEGIESGIVEGENKPTGAKVDIKPMAEMLQKDALFLEYDDASRLKVQSSFRLPDIYVGRSHDYNRATAETSRYITEEQVFEPERKPIEFVINHKLLTGYNLKHAMLNFKTPEISDTDSTVKMLEAMSKYAGLTINDVRRIGSKSLGENLEPLNIPEGDLPLEITKLIKAASMAVNQPNGGNTNPANQKRSEDGSETNNEDSVQKEWINILKDIRDEVEGNE